MPNKYPSQFVANLLKGVAYAVSKPLWFIRFHGRENIPPSDAGGFVIAANHQTYIDPVWITLPMRRRVRFMAFDRAFGWRFVGPFIRYLGAFPVALDRGGRVRSIKGSLRALREGAAVVIFPEGGRALASGEFDEFKPGTVRIAMQAGVPILPVTITGGNRIWPQGQKYPKLFRRVEITYHPLMQIDADADPEVETERLRKIIASVAV